jgi:hypothetical protein
LIPHHTGVEHWHWVHPWLWSNATWGGLTFLVLLAAAVVAFFQLGEARRLREARLRPFVTVDFEVEEKIISIIVANVGATQARDVKVVFDPPLESATVGEFPELLPRFQEILASGRLSLPPGKTITTSLDLAPQRKTAGLPDDYEVTVEYTADVTGRRYRQTTPLDLALYFSRGRFTRPDETHRRLKEIVEELRAWRVGAGRQAEGG